jgi:hypothetical protein
MEILLLFLILSLILNIFLIRRSTKIIDELELLEMNFFEFKLFIRDSIKNTLSKMREIDSRGSFESDDEVGAIFNELKATLQETTELLLNETKEEK